MWKALVEKILFKYGYIHREAISTHLTQSRKEQRRLDEVEFDLKFVDFKQRIETDHQLSLDDKEAEISLLIARIEELKSRVKEIETVYFKSIKRTKSNARLAGELGFQVDRLMKAVAEIAASFKNIEDQASGHLQSLEREAVKERKLLRLDRY